MKKLSISETVRYLLKQHQDLSVSELSRQTNIPQPTLHHLLNGSTKRPRDKVLEKLAQFFSVSIAQLNGDEPIIPSFSMEIKQSLGLTSLPIISWEEIINWPTKTAYSHKEVLFDQEISDNSYALLMNNSTMEPVFPLNSLLIFDFQKQPADREYSLVYLAKEKSLILNKLFIEDNELFIKSQQFSTTFQLIKINPDYDKLLGTLVEVRLNLLKNN